MGTAFGKLYQSTGAIKRCCRIVSATKIVLPGKQGLIQAFEFTHELAWNTLKDYFTYQGNTAITGSRDATREAFKFNLIQDGEGWMEMIQSRNQTSHTYNLQIANEIESKICQQYCLLFNELLKKLSDIYV